MFGRSIGEFERYRRNEIESSVAHLKLVAGELKRNPFSPDAVTLFQQAFWRVPRGEEGFTFNIRSCAATKEQLRKPFIDINDGRELPPLTIGIPEELKGKDGLITLGKMFPELGSVCVKEDTPIEDEFDKTGYIQVEGIVDAPNFHTDEEVLGKHFDSQGVHGQRLITYIIASKQMEILHEDEGRYFDQGFTRSRLLGSRRESKVVDARFLPLGQLVVGRFLHSQAQSDRLGGRSERPL